MEYSAQLPVPLLRKLTRFPIRSLRASLPTATSLKASSCWEWPLEIASADEEIVAWVDGAGLHLDENLIFSWHGLWFGGVDRNITVVFNDDGVNLLWFHC